MRSFSYKHGAQKGAVDLSVLISLCLLCFVIAGAAVYFLILGIPPTNTSNIVGRVMTAAGSAESYTVKLQVVPATEFFMQSKITGRVTFDLRRGKTDGTFDVPLLTADGAAMSRMEAFVSGGEVLARYIPDETTPKDMKVFPREWFKLDTKDKPIEYRVLEQAFALSDFTKILKNGSGFVTTQNDAVKEKQGEANVWHVVFRRPETFPPGLPNEHLAFFSALSDSHDIDIWVDEKTYDVLQMHFVINGFDVTAVITDLNKPNDLAVPKDVLAYPEWKTKLAAASVPNLTPITQISIGSYGEIKPAYLEGIRQAIQKATGITTTVLNSAPTPEKKELIWEKELSGWNGNALLSGVQQISKSFGPNVRILYVVGDKMYSVFEKNQIWSRGEFGSNASVISLAGLDERVAISMAMTATTTTTTATTTVPVTSATSTTSAKVAETADSSVAPESVVIARAQKIALQALGETVGFDIAPLAGNTTCAMYPFKTVAEIDVLGKAYCQPELGYIPQIFKKTTAKKK